MVLTRSYPLLFGIPTARDSKLVFFSAILFLGMSIAGYIIDGIWSKFPFFEFFTILLALHAVVSILSIRRNFFYLVRYFLVWFLIFVTCLVWAIFDGEMKVAPFGTQFQTSEITRVLVFGGFLSLCGSLLGWHTSLHSICSQDIGNFVLRSPDRARLRRAGIFLVVVFSLLYLYKSGGFISGASVYGSKTRDVGFVFGVFNIFHFLGISLLLISSISYSRIRLRYLLLSMASLFLGLLAGSRADFLPQFFILLLVIFNFRAISEITRVNRFKVFASFVLFLLLLVVGYLSAFFLGLWRSGLSVDAALLVMLELGAELIYRDVGAFRMLYLETGNMMLGGFYAAIYNVREEVTGLLLGGSYYNYFLTAPPAFLGLPRPLGLEWSANINGIPMSQGGIFEVAEAYWNFGLIGCFGVSFFLSYSFGWILKHGLLANNYFFLVWYITFGLHSFRSIWYQNFGYFRLMTIMLLIYLFAMFTFRWFVTKKPHTLNANKWQYSR